MGLFGVVFVLKPEWTGSIARDLGVGRGTDLMMYLGFTGLGFFVLMLWSKLRDMDARLTAIVRELALKNSAEPVFKEKTK